MSPLGPIAGDGSPGLIGPEWPVPARVRAAVTTRQGGCSLAPFESLNLAEHVGDDLQSVQKNRGRLREALQLPQEPGWLQQVHGTRTVQLPLRAVPEADASVSRISGLACAILTADCLPVLFCDAAGTVVAAAHAGWRGLLNGVLENTITAMACPSGQILAWLGPAIGPDAFEVGSEVRDAFVRKNASADAAFRAAAPGKYMADLYALARQRLKAAGVHRIYGGGECTYHDTQRFYSFRREARCGRMASLIWMQD